MQTIAYDQRAAFKTCTELRYTNIEGNNVFCGMRVCDRTCELGHIQNLDSISDQEYDEVLSEESCEHGLSLWLCAGPGHYPADNYY